VPLSQFGSDGEEALRFSAVQNYVRGPERRYVRGLILTRLGGNRTLGSSRKKHQRLTIQPAKLHRRAQTFAAPCIEPDDLILRNAVEMIIRPKA
jgi:hypothetical protein